MSEQTERLAARFERANAEFIATIQDFSDHQWQAPCAADSRPVGVVALHVAQGHALLPGLAREMAAGHAVPPLSWEMIHGANAEHATRHARPDKAATIALLRENGAAAANMIRGITEDQLGCSASLPFMGDTPVTVQQFVERVIIGHMGMHLADMRAASGVAPSERVH